MGFSEEEEEAMTELEVQPRTLWMLDCFCGLGGVSDGFSMEGFDVLGIDIEDMSSKGYKHKFLRADIRDLKGEDYRGYDVIWGSPPCRDFSTIGRLYGKKWKIPPNPERGLILVKALLKFVDDAKPRIWVMENVVGLKKHLQELEPRTETYITCGKKHVFYGNYPLFLMPRDMRIKIRTTIKGRDQPNYLIPSQKTHKLRSWVFAKIPLSCSRAFARACKEALLK